MAEDLCSSEGPQPPPESALCGATGSSWWGEWIQAAKEKSASALEFMKKDVAEFTQTMQSDSESLACNFRSKLTQETAVAASQKVKQGVSLLLDGIKTALILPPDDMDEDESEPITFSSSEHIFDRAKARIHAIQIDPGTYCNEPAGSREDFEKWRDSFDLEAKKGDISELLVSNVEVRAMYTQMVPSTVSHSDFWQRYFYKLWQLEQEDKRRAELMKRAEKTTDTDLAWDDDDDWENMASSDKPSDCAASDSESAGAIAKETKPETTDVKMEEDIAKSEPVKTETVPPKDEDTKEIDVKSTAECSSKDSLTETINVLSALDTPTTAQETGQSLTEPHKNGTLHTKETGDLVVVGNNGSSIRTSPSSSESNSHNKESLDEDWEKDFDIEVTEEELQAELKSAPLNTKEEEEDWENWE